LLPIDKLPNVAALRAQNVPWLETAAVFDAKLAQIQSTIDQYNKALVEAAKPYRNVHIVDVWTATNTIFENGPDVGSRVP
jgi:hypothetical protein